MPMSKPTASDNPTAEERFECEPHSSSLSQVFQSLDSNENGLSQAQARERYDQYGPNSLPQTKPTPAWLRLLRQFHNPLLYVLWASAGISFYLQHYVDAGVIVGVVVINGLVGFIQEGRAEKALLAILAMVTTRTKVWRDGSRVSVDGTELVPGDVLQLEAGDRVPADIRIIADQELRCDESALTGESQTISKENKELPENTPLAERFNMAYMGTLVASGTGKGVVTHTGQHTEFGNISTLVQKVNLVKTPLQTQLARFAKQLSIGIVIIAIVMVAYGIFVQQYSFAEMFQGAIGIAVAAIPEGLPAVVTITLAIGVQRMARHRALVRQLPAVEVLGSVDVICTDKTGTLTTNVMSTREVATADEILKVSGEGYGDEGKVHNHNNGKVQAGDHRVIDVAARIALLCNDADVKKENGNWHLHGDPTEGALLSFALKSQLAIAREQSQWPRVDEIPFTSDRRYMATLNKNPEGDAYIFVKGAPEKVIPCCQSQLTLDGCADIEREYWQQQLKKMADRGMRIIALAYKPHTNDQEFKPEIVEQDLVLAAFVGIADPPRKEAIDAITSCHRAGIRVKMITGDNPITAAAIGRELGLNTKRVLTGQELDALNAEEFCAAADDVDIYARTSPENKLQLVKALQGNGHVVAMTGDGVNDAPALKHANIGVAMGKKGSDVAKEAAHFILTDDNFATITRAIREGRTVYDNIVKSILYLLPTSFAEASVIVLAILFGVILPITPAQVLWVNMVTAITLALALAFELGEDNIMQRRPRPPRQSFITPVLMVRLLLIVAIVAGVIFWLFSSQMQQGQSVAYSRTMAVNALVLFEVFYLINSRYLYQSSLSLRAFRHSGPALISIGAVMVLQLAFTYLPLSQQIFALAPLSASDWLYLVLLTSPILLIVEAEKALPRLWRRISGNKNTSTKSIA